MGVDEAIRILGLAAPATAPAGRLDPALVRSAFLDAIRRAHPDVNHRVGATDEAARLIRAYGVVRRHLDADPADPADPLGRPTSPEHPTPSGEPVDASPVVVVGDDTIEIAAPLDLTFGWLVQAGHAAGDVIFLDRSAPILQILVSFVDEPVCQVIFDLQGRAARGTTEVFCTVESLDDRPAPPIEAVTRFMADQLRVCVDGS